MIHADINIACSGEPANGQLQNLQLGFTSGQVSFIDLPLGLHQRRQVRIAVERNTIGVQIKHGVERSIKALDSLLGQAINQIHAH